jgi:hypothetical protein
VAQDIRALFGIVPAAAYAATTAGRTRGEYRRLLAEGIARYGRGGRPRGEPAMKPSGKHGSATIPANSFLSTSAASANASMRTLSAVGGSASAASDGHHRNERGARRGTRNPGADASSPFAFHAARINRAGR